METAKKPEDKFPQLLEREVPELSQAQIGRFSYDNVHPSEVGSFDPQVALRKLRRQAGARVVGIDVGGDKALFQSFVVETDGGLSTDSSYHDLQKDNDGEGYVAGMERAANFAEKQAIPGGISIGFPLDGSKPKPGDKLPKLLKDLDEKYSGDFANLPFPKLACLNDAPAGLVSGAIHANLLLDQKIDTVIYLINGGGIGAAVLKNGTITATEAGHVEVVPELNRYQDSRECGLFGSKNTCIELVAGNKLGVEEIWQKKTGNPLNALEIERRFTQSQPDGELALELYDYSAYMVAHVARGLAHAFDIDLNDPNVAIVGHGGAFKFPNYGNRIRQILEENGSTTRLILTKDFSDNACAEGAAIAAITS